jgi:CBS domain containing-hemolysin-like protein
VDALTYVLDGKMMINDVCRLVGIPPETFDSVKGESDSVAGLILEMAGEFPEAGRIIPCLNFEFTVLEVGKMRVRKVKMQIHPISAETA